MPDNRRFAVLVGCCSSTVDDEVSGAPTAELDLETRLLNVKPLSMPQHTQYRSTLSLRIFLNIPTDVFDSQQLAYYTQDASIFPSRPMFTSRSPIVIVLSHRRWPMTDI